MKRKLIIGCSWVLIALFFATCKPDKSFDSALLIGKWERNSPLATAEKQGNEYYRYNANGTGATWDTADDVQENEAQTFSWTLEKDLLTLIHDMEMGGSKVPKYYIVTVLDASTLTYKNDYGSSFTFKKSK
jgi:hypothetical protein